MKAVTNLVKGIMIVMLSILMFSCSDGEDGTIGPEGPAGIDGQDGTNGTNGEPGTANVIYSEWIARNFFIAGANDDNFQGLEVLDSNEFNENTDVVLVFGRRGTEGDYDIYPLPYILASQDEYYGFGILSATGGFSLQVRVNTLDGGTNLFTFFSDFRYVIIPGGVAKSAKDYKSMSYKEIRALLNIPE